MERDWEKRYATPHISIERIVELLREAGCERPVRACDDLGGGCVNLNMHLRLGAPEEDVVLRFYLRDAAAAAKEAALLTHLADVVPVPRVLRAGTCALEIEGETRPTPWLLLSWIPGRCLDARWDDRTPAAHARAGEELGGALGRLHAAQQTHLGFLDAALEVPTPMGGLRDVWRGYLRDMIASERARVRLGASRRRRLEAFVRDQEQALMPLEGHYSLLHADCKPTNVFVDEAGAVTGLIDWEFAWSGPPLFDLGQMLRWPVPAAFEETLLAGYAAAGGCLAEGWRTCARLLDLMNLVGFLEMQGERPMQIRDVLGLIDRYLAPDA